MAYPEPMTDIRQRIIEKAQLAWPRDAIAIAGAREMAILIRERFAEEDDWLGQRHVLRKIDDLVALLTVGGRAELENDHGGTSLTEGASVSVSVPADQLSHAVRDAEVLEQRAERLLMTYTARFEQDADEFYRATGFMAPGRSVPAAMGGYDEDQRQAEWDRWVAEQTDLFRWALLAGAAALKKIGRVSSSLSEASPDTAQEERGLR